MTSMKRIFIEAKDFQKKLDSFKDVDLLRNFQEAIAKDQLTWSQVSNLKFWEDPIAMQYNVKSVPAAFLLDANGNIIAKDLRGAELKAKVAELLAK